MASYFSSIPLILGSSTLNRTKSFSGGRLQIAFWMGPAGFSLETFSTTQRSMFGAAWTRSRLLHSANRVLTRTPYRRERSLFLTDILTSLRCHSPQTALQEEQQYSGPRTPELVIPTAIPIREFCGPLTRLISRKSFGTANSNAIFPEVGQSGPLRQSRMGKCIWRPSIM